jgi:hypothetical protein
MPEGVGYSGSNVVAGAGLELNYVGNHVYAASGIVNDSGTGGPNATLLNFVTGANAIVATLDFNDDSTGGSDIYFRMKYNGISVLDAKGGQEFLPWKYDIFIPPYTNVEVLWGSQSNFNGNAFLSGKTI